MVPIEISCDEVHSRLKDDESPAFFLLDCREQEEWETVRIDSATLLPMSEIQDRAGELDAHRDKDVIVYCHHGGRSLRVANWLRQQGFDKARSMSGGIDEWAERIDPSLPRY